MPEAFSLQQPSAASAAEEELEFRPDLYRQIFIHSTEPIAIINPQGQYVEQNAAHFQLLGYSDDELMGQTPAIHLGEEVFEGIAAELTERGEYRGEVASRTKTGEIRQVELLAFAVRNGRGEPTCYVGIKHDITDRKRTESRYALQYAVTSILAESADFVECARSVLQTFCARLEWDFGAFWKVDRGAQVLRCVEVCRSPSSQLERFERVTLKGTFEKGVGLPGRVWESGKPAWIDNVGADRNFPRATIAAHEGLHSAFAFPILAVGEVLGVIEFFSREMLEPDDELLRMVAGIGWQIGQFTIRQRAEEDRTELLDRETTARSEAEKANRLKDEFLATLSHELRTPLNAVIGWARMLKSGRLDQESSTHALDVIERNAWAQKQIIEDILDVSRVITGKLQLNLGPVDLVAVVDAALDAVRPALEAKNIHIETIIDAGLRIVPGDSDRLQQVVWNLLSNAAKFTPEGGKVEVRVSQDVAHVQVQVCDTGPGIDPIFLPHVFERFRQADGSITRMHGGLGLGLAIVRHLVELHGGVITAENRPDGGAVFTLRLRLPSGELRTDVMAAEFFKEPEPETANLENLRILIVDDERDTLDLVTMELTEHGAKVTGVTTAEEAFSILETSEFDVLISDIAMPGTDGYALIRKLRKLEAGHETKLPAVALTAYARVQDRMRAILAGFNTHVAKPVEANELITVVASLAGRLGKN
ncbi:MAG TPA: ATP-binding protein [Pyrinomonadaceae bacterium]|nr:ATP-binding protein [Pyrinomonadaceae bacterium]